jgi:hypothetical protein
MILSVLILPMLTLYHRPKQIESDEQGRLYQAEIIQTVGDLQPSRELLRKAWERLKTTWQFGFWPSAAAIVEAIREERKLLPPPPPAPAGTAQVGHTPWVSPARIAEIFATDVGRQCLEGDLGRIILTDFIATGKVQGPQDLTQDVVNVAERVHSRFHIALRDAASGARTNGYLARVHNLGIAMLEANERLKAEHLPGYQPRRFDRKEIPYASASDLAPKPVHVPMRRAAAEEEPPPITTVPDGPPADTYAAVF